MDKYLLSIDGGLTKIKAVLFNLDGTLVNSESTENEIIDRGDFSEIDMGLLWEKTAKIINNLIKKIKINAKQIVSVGCSGHGGGLYLIGRDGEPVRKAISSMDSRTNDLIERWNKDGLNTYSKTFTHRWSGQAIPLLYWLKENEKENYKKINKILWMKDWINYRLTSKFSTDYTDASNAGLINLLTKNYDLELYSEYGLKNLEEKLPKLNESKNLIGFVTSNASRETGLEPGTPVISGLIDLVACALGSGVYDENLYSIISGTWSINTGVCNNLLQTENIMSCFLYADINKFLAMEASPTSAVNLEWFLRTILGYFNNGIDDIKKVYQKVDNGVSRIKEVDPELFYFPFIYKSKLTTKMGGGFYGLKASHNIYNLLQSLFEGVIYAHSIHINNLKLGGVKRQKAVLSGGASNSKIWCQMFADILNMEILTTEVSEAGALGTAICSAIGAGVYKNFKTAIDKIVKIKSEYSPNIAKNSIYAEKMDKFSKLIKIYNEFF